MNLREKSRYMNDLKLLTCETVKEIYTSNVDVTREEKRCDENKNMRRGHT